MNPIIKKLSLQIGLLLAFIQIAIILYMYYFGSFISMNTGLLIIALNILFGITSIIIIKKKLDNQISLRESFSGYFVTLLISMILSNVFYVAFFNIVADEVKKEKIIQEFYSFNLKNMDENSFSKEDYNKNKELLKNFNPFSISTTFQRNLRFLLLYSVFGILISVIFRNKTSFQESNI